MAYEFTFADFAALDDSTAISISLTERKVQVLLSAMSYFERNIEPSDDGDAMVADVLSALSIGA